MSDEHRDRTDRDRADEAESDPQRTEDDFPTGMLASPTRIRL